MFGQRAVAGLAVHVRVLPGILGFQDVGMAHLARGVAGEGHRLHAVFEGSFIAVMAVGSEVSRDDNAPDYQEEDEPGYEQQRYPAEVLRVVEGFPHGSRGWRSGGQFQALGAVTEILSEIIGAMLLKTHHMFR